MEYGLNTLAKTGRNVNVLADGNTSGVKAGGVSLDVNTIAAVTGSPVTLTDDTVVPIGQQYLRFGQILTKITSTAADVATIGGGATGGTFTLTVTNAGGTTTTGALAFAATAATVQAALVGLANVGAGNAVVTGSAGGPWTITYADSLGAVVTTGSPASLTGGTPTLTFVASAPGGDVGKFGPYDPAAADGRQNLTRGEAFVLNRTWLLSPSVGFPNMGTLHPMVFDAGLVWRERLLITTGSHSLAVGPTVTEFEEVFPMIRYVKQ